MYNISLPLHPCFVLFYYHLDGCFSKNRIYRPRLLFLSWEVQTLTVLFRNREYSVESARVEESRERP
jgi:hypothetical protein